MAGTYVANRMPCVTGCPVRRCPVVPPPRVWCPHCGRWDVGVPVEHGRPDGDLFARAKRGEVVVRDDAPVVDTDDWLCTACGRGFSGESTTGGLRVVAPSALVRSGYDAAVRLLNDRAALASAVCRALVESVSGPDPAPDPDAEPVRRAREALRVWIARHYPLAAPRYGVHAGLDRIVVPADHVHVAAVLDAATAVCGTLELGGDGVRGRLTDVLAEYTRCVALPAPPADPAQVPRADADVVAPDTPPDGIDAVIDELLGLAAAHPPAVLRRAPEPVEDGWDEVAPLAGDLFPRGSSAPWARWVWTALHRAGLTDCATEVDRTRVLVRLVALSVLHQEFAARAFATGTPGDWAVDDVVVVGDGPRIDPFLLGMLAERDGVAADADVGYVFLEGSAAGHALVTLVRAEYELVARALLDEVKLAPLFAALWATADAGAGYPPPAAPVDSAPDGAPDAAQVVAYDWVHRGMPLD